ncbi:MAG TPA: sigma-70 family RNA polymerase sigma factor [Vicinamibacterales bacterium]|nr:sigma-70 family RNA polymerase sigma factor [Vicinamibacterales bacterium]
MRMREAHAERQLIGRMQSGDSSAVAELASTYGPRIQQLAFRYVKNWEDAEEVTQDVLMKVFRKIDAFRGDAALSSWIYRITFNTAMSRLRSAKGMRQLEPFRVESGSTPSAERVEEPVDWSAMADDHVLRRELRQRLVGALRHLPVVYRVPVILRDIQGLSTEEASAVLRVKPQTLKSRLHRGRLILRKHLADFAGGVMMHAREAVN